MTECPNEWKYGVSGPEQREKLTPLTDALHSLAEAGLTAAVVIANFHRRWVVPLMERALPIFKIMESADPAALAGSRMLEEPLLVAYAATRVKCAVETRKMRCGDYDLWSFKMRPEEGYFPVVSIRSLPCQSWLDSVSAVYSDRCYDNRNYPASTTRRPPRLTLAQTIVFGNSSKRRGRTRRRRRGGGTSGRRRTRQRS